MPLKLLDLPGQLGGLAVVVASMLAFFNPLNIGRVITTEAARHAGMAGYVYYGRPVLGPAKGMATFYLIRTGKRDFADLRYGDMLQAIRDTNFRTGPSPDQPIMFAVKKDQCVVVTSAPRAASALAPDGTWRPLDITKEKPRADESVEGGFIQVATTSCGMFE